MRYIETDNLLSQLYLEGSEANWVEGSNHRWGEYVCPDGLTVSVSRRLENDILIEDYLFSNSTDRDIPFAKGELGVWTPFNDNYDGAINCKKYKCHAHIWCGGTSSWVNALAMKSVPPHLGLMLTAGSLCGYSVERENNSNDRGDFLLLATPDTVKAGETYRLSWELFAHTGDFFERLKDYPTYIPVEAPYFTFFENEMPAVQVKGTLLPLENTLGYHQVSVDDSWFRYQVKPPLDAIAVKRCQFIKDYQQETEGLLHGAYLIYDNETHTRFFEEMPHPDHNAGRERVGMGTLIARVLQRHYDATLHESLKKYVDFVLQNYFDEEQGIVYNMSPRNNTRRRIYNNAWYATFFRELYRLEKNRRWLDCMFKAFRDLYQNGGLKFYPLAMELTDSIRVLEEAGLMAEKEQLMAWFTQNAEYMIRLGTDYPNFEVKMEDNIVVPAGMLLVQMYGLTGEQRYLDEARQHIQMHDIFVGFQPDARMHGVAIHHWDDFWFGKRRLYGDTYPHYWSGAGALLYAEMYRHTHDASYLDRARACLRSTLSNYFEDGSATCAIFTPFQSNGIAGDFIDPWANDQDWALYFSLVFDDDFGL